MCTPDTPLEGADVLYSDQNLLILNKESGISVIPGRGASGLHSLRWSAEKWIGRKLFVVHRIDHDTSGVVVFCRDAATHRLLSLQFQNREVIKWYYALVLGRMAGEGIIDEPVFEFGSGRMGVDPRGKPSQTVYKVEEALENATLLKLKPLTGRRHQIRVHLFSIGHPVMGDRLYGRQRPVGGVERLMLHAASITFSYPGERQFSINAPQDDLWNVIVERHRASSPAK